MVSFKTFWSAASILAGIATVHMIRKGQLDSADGQPTSAADSFYSLAS